MPPKLQHRSREGQRMSGPQAAPKEGARFTKISDRGEVLPRDAADWAVVHDAFLGAFWLRKSIKGKSHSACMKAAAKVTAAGLDGWRAPTRLELFNLVDETKRAWHAGVSTWGKSKQSERYVYRH